MSRGVRALHLSGTRSWHSALALCSVAVLLAASVRVATASSDANANNANHLGRATVANPGGNTRFAPVYNYTAVPVGACNVTCGSGWQNTTLACVDRRQNVVALSNCAGVAAVPTPEVPCRMLPCPSYQLVISDWSACDATCGNGTQSRTVTCRERQGGNPVPLSQCASGANTNVVGNRNLGDSTSAAIDVTSIATSASCFKRCTSQYR